MEVKCPLCHNHINREGAKFCPYCGASLSGETGLSAEKLDTPAIMRKTPVEVSEGESVRSLKAYLRSRTVLLVVLPVIMLLFAGGWLYTYLQGYILDVEPPQVVILSPENNRTISLAPARPVEETVKVSARDNRKVKRIALYLDGSLVKEVNGEKLLTYQWLVDKEGEHTFRACAYDSKENEAWAATTVNVKWDVPPAQVKTKNIANETEFIDIDLQIPVLEGLQNKGMESAINSAIAKSVDAQEVRVREWLTDEMKIRYYQGSFPKFMLKGDYKVHYNENGLLSIVMSYYRYTGGAHGSSELQAFNVDLKTGRELLIKDFYREGEDWEGIVKRAIYNQMLAEPEKYFPEVLRWWNSKPLNPNQHFYVGGDNYLVIYFDEYEIGPYAIGIPEFKVPISRSPQEVKASGRSL